jgi:circadian clock protein KaiC
MPSKPKEERIPTFIPGFDNLIDGGFLRKSVNLISGGPGTGKSIFCLEFLYNGITKANQKGLFISFEEECDELKEDAKAFGWDFDELEKKGLVKFIYFYPYEITNFHSRLMSEITSMNAERIVIDSTSTFGMALEGEYEVRKELYTLAKQLKKLNCSTIITSEIVGESYLEHHDAGEMSRFGVEEFISDSVITFHHLGFGGKDDKALRIIKMRRTNHFRGAVPMIITNDGIKIIDKQIKIP